MLPVAIVGAERIWDGRRLRRPWVELRIGAPMTFHRPRSAAADYAHMTADLRAAVVELHEAA